MSEYVKLCGKLFGENPDGGACILPSSHVGHHTYVSTAALSLTEEALRAELAKVTAERDAVGSERDDATEEVSRQRGVAEGLRLDLARRNDELADAREGCQRLAADLAASRKLADERDELREHLTAAHRATGAVEIANARLEGQLAEARRLLGEHVHHVLCEEADVADSVTDVRCVDLTDPNGRPTCIMCRTRAFLASVGEQSKPRELPPGEGSKIPTYDLHLGDVTNVPRCPKCDSYIIADRCVNGCSGSDDPEGR